MVIAHYLVEKKTKQYCIIDEGLLLFFLFHINMVLVIFAMIRKVFIKSYNTGARIHVPRQCEACLIIEPFLDTMFVSFAPWIHRSCGIEIWSETWGQVLEGGRVGGS